MAIIAFSGSPLATSIKSVDRVVILGKGPSSDRTTAEIKFGGTQVVIALNDAYRLTPAFTAVHFTDYEAAKRADFDHKREVICPGHPHINNKPDPTRDAFSMLDDCPVLRRAYDRSDLYCYTGSTAKGKKFGKGWAGPIVTVKLFSAVTVTDLVLLAGAKAIHYIGVDQGQGYGKKFQDLTPLTNGRKSFDGQFPLINRMAWAAGVSITFARNP